MLLEVSGILHTPQRIYILLGKCKPRSMYAESQNLGHICVLVPRTVLFCDGQAEREQR